MLETGNSQKTFPIGLTAMLQGFRTDPTARRSAGFTLVEILVAVSIVALLLLLLMPVVNNARHSGQRTACMANQTRLAFAMAKFDSAQGFLPGWRNSLVMADTTTRKASWAVVLLPYLEKNDIYNQLLDRLLWETGNKLTPVNQGVLISELLCPSVMTANVYQAVPYSILHYGVNIGSGDNSKPADGVLMDNTTNVRQSFGDIIRGDGLTNTLLHADLVIKPEWWPTGGGPAWHVQMTGSGAYDGENSKALLMGTRGSTVPAAVINWQFNSSLGLQDWQRSAPRGAHPGGVVATFCDGRSKFLKDDLDPHVYAHLITSRSFANSANTTAWVGSTAPPTDSDY